MSPGDASTDGRALRPGSVVGNYVIQTVLGQGGFGITYLAEHQQLGRRTALKECLPGDLATRQADTTVQPHSESMRPSFDAAVAAFMNEARTLATFEHPNIVPVYEVFAAAGTGYMATKYIDGQPLDAWAAPFGNRIPPKALGRVLPPILDALEAVHEAGIIHRDLKPGNILVTATGDPILIDFGAARQTVEGRTRTMTAVLTPGYAPIEQYDGGGRQGPFTDLYALSATLYRLIRGELPPAASMRVIDDTFAPLSDDPALADYPVGVLRALDRALAVNPKERPQTVAAFRELTEARTIGDLPTLAPPVTFQDAETLQPPRPKAPKPDPVPASTPPVRPAPAAPAKPTPAPSAAKKKSARQRSPLAAVLILALVIGGIGVAGWFAWSEYRPMAGPDTPVAQSDADDSTTPGETARIAEDPEPAPPSASSGFVLRVSPAHAEARVWMGDYSNHAVKDGSAVLEGLAAGRQRLRVDAPGFQPYNSFVPVGDDGGGELAVDLVPVMGDLRIEADPGTRVVALAPGGREIELGMTDARGILTADDILNIGTYDLRLTKPDHRPSVERGIELVLGKVAEVTVDLAPLPGRLDVFSLPRGAAIFVNGERKGETSTTLDGIPAETELTVEVRRSGYRTERQRLTLAPAETREVDFGTLVAEAGGLEVTLVRALVNPGALRLALNGDPQPSLRLSGLEVGQHTVALTHPDYAPWSQRVTVRDGETTPVSAALTPKPGRLTVSVSPPDAARGAVLRVSGEEVRGFQPGQPVLIKAEQAVTLEVAAEGFRAATRDLTMAPNGSDRWRVTLEEQPGPSPGEDWTVELPGGVSLDLVYIRPGTFTMGSPSSEDGRDSDERQHRVTLTQGYWMGKYEVTQGQWRALMGSNPSHFTKAGSNAPVESVSWTEAMAFCRRLTEQERAAGRLPSGYEYTLPTEAQWEYACRAGTTTAFHYGNRLDATMANFDGDYPYGGAPKGKDRRTTIAVGSFRPNAWGLYDMHGNVWEWCYDWYDSDYPSGSVTDPRGPDSGSPRVGRGGSWGGSAGSCRSANRSGLPPGIRGNDLGFRLCLAPSSR